MTSPNAQALYDRLLKQGIDGKSKLPDARVPGRMESASDEDEHGHEGKAGGDLAPEKQEDPSEEIRFDESTSDMAASLRHLDQGQHELHPGDQGIDPKSSARMVQTPSNGELHTTSKSGHMSSSEGSPGGSFGHTKIDGQGPDVHSDMIGKAILGLHHKSHPGSLGEKLSSAVETARAKKKV